MSKVNIFYTVAIVGLIGGQAVQAQSITPAGGQSPEQMNYDQATCSQVASSASGYVPNAAEPSESRGRSAVGKAAKGAALGAVVGAIAGDAGKGAAVGAAAGGASGIVGKQKGLVGGGLGGAAVGAAAGAAGGDAGKGAAIGAAAGALGGAVRKSREENKIEAYNQAFFDCMRKQGYTVN